MGAAKADDNEAGNCVILNMPKKPNCSEIMYPIENLKKASNTGLLYSTVTGA